VSQRSLDSRGPFGAASGRCSRWQAARFTLRVVQALPTGALHPAEGPSQQQRATSGRGRAALVAQSGCEQLASAAPVWGLFLGDGERNDASWPGRVESPRPIGRRPLHRRAALPIAKEVRLQLLPSSGGSPHSTPRAPAVHSAQLLVRILAPSPRTAPYLLSAHLEQPHIARPPCISRPHCVTAQARCFSARQASCSAASRLRTGNLAAHARRASFLIPPRRIRRVSDRQHTPVTRRCWTLLV
jgi:hypothetical protein